MRILISSAGRRVGLMRCFRDSFERLGIQGEVVAIDASPDAPALQFADLRWQSPRCDAPGFVPALLEFAAREGIDLIVPTIDPELPVYARARQQFIEAGIEVSISEPETVLICADKQRTHEWLRNLDVPVPEQRNLAAMASGTSLSAGNFPLIVKPRNGSGSIGIRCIASIAELQAAIDTAMVAGRLEDYVVERIAPGREFTINVFLDEEGRCLAAVPHCRLEVRAGEVSKAVTLKHQGLITLAGRIAETLPGARGPMTIQCFLSADDAVQVTEINARFGGGYPLTHRAGARFTDWLLESVDKRRRVAAISMTRPVANHSRPERIKPCEDWTDQLTMLRYDHEIFLPPASHGIRSPRIQ